MNKMIHRPPWRRRMLWLPAFLLLPLLLLLLPHFADLVSGARVRPARTVKARWVGTWGTAPVVGLPLGEMHATTFRNRVHTSIAGATIRVQFSNAFGTQPIRLTQATVALAATPNSALAQIGTMKPFTFAGRAAVAIPIGEQVYTDPLTFSVPAEGDLLITVSVPAASGLVTAHVSGLQTSWYATSGNHAADLEATAFTQSMNAWYYVTVVEVESTLVRGTLVALGDSITAGTGSIMNANQRWTDDLAHTLLCLPLSQQYGILNEGIASNRLLVDGVGMSALHRLDSDVFAHNNVKVLILLEGVNDIRNGASGADIIAGLEQIATLVHARGIRLLVGTLTPFAGSLGYTEREEEERQQVNAFLRAQSLEARGSSFDGIIDFDAAVRDPYHPLQFLPVYDSGDHLHPSGQGYQAMSDAIPLAQL